MLPVIRRKGFQLSAAGLFGGKGEIMERPGTSASRDAPGGSLAEVRLWRENN